VLFLMTLSSVLRGPQSPRLLGQTPEETTQNYLKTISQLKAREEREKAREERNEREQKAEPSHNASTREAVR
jgi:hypothetical protein